MGSRQVSEAPCTSNAHDFIILRRSLQHPQEKEVSTRPRLGQRPSDFSPRRSARAGGHQESEQALPGPRRSPGSRSHSHGRKGSQQTPGRFPTFPRLRDGPETPESPAGKNTDFFPRVLRCFCKSDSGRHDLQPDNEMTQPLEGAAVLASLAEFWGRPATLAAPQRAGIRPRPGGQASGAPPRPPPLRRPRCGLETFPAPAPAPTRASQLELVELEAGSALPVAPTRLPRQPGVGSPPPRLTSGKSRRQEPREVRPGRGQQEGRP